jgi:hypothetical protein
LFWWWSHQSTKQALFLFYTHQTLVCLSIYLYLCLFFFLLFLFF